MLPTLHNGSQPQISRTKRSSNAAPYSVWMTSE